MRIELGRKSRTWAGRLVGAGALAALLIGFAAPASAKGPESVSIRGPGLTQPLDLMAGADPDQVARLMEQTGLWYGTGDLPVPIVEPQGELGAAYSLTWVNGGPPGKSQADRTIEQFIYLDAQGGPVIHTPPQDSLEGWGQGVIGWFRAPQGLRDTLAGLGVPIVPSAGRGDGLVEPLGGSVIAALPFLAVAGAVIFVGLAVLLAAQLIVRRRHRRAPVE